MADLNSTIVRGKLRVTEDINANGNITTNGNITGNGSGLTNLNASNISSGTLSADRLATSGVTASSYGPSKNATPAYGDTFNVPYITVDNKGRVTAASTKTVKIPASDNTWRGIQDNLTSTSTTDSLSANQGRVLKGLVDGKSDSGHTHNYAGSSSAGGPANSVKNALTFGSKTYNGSSAQTITKNDVGLGNVDNTADSQKNVHYAESAGELWNQNGGKGIAFEGIWKMFSSAKVRYIDTSKSSSSSTMVYYNNMLADNKEKISITMNKTTISEIYGIYDDTVGDVINTEELHVGDIIIVKGYYPRYISKKVVSTYTRDFEFTILNKIRVTDKSMSDIMNSTTTESAYCQLGDLLIQWGVVTGVHGDTTNWRVEYPMSFLWYPAVILQTKDTITTNQGIPYSNGAVITDYDRGKSFTFQLRRSETCPVYWIAVGGATY